METQGAPTNCQIKCLKQMSDPLGRIEIIWQLRLKVKRVLKRRINLIHNRLSSADRVANTLFGTKGTPPAKPF